MPTPTRSFTGRPVRYADGIVALGATDLSSDGFGMPWDLSRSWSNNTAYSGGSANGNGWVDSEQPWLYRDGSKLVLASNATDAAYFDGQGSADAYGNYTTYAPRRDNLSGISYDSTNDRFVLADPSGSVFRFAGFRSNLQTTIAPGAMLSMTAADGSVTQVTSWASNGLAAEFQGAVGSGSTAVTESYAYTYSGSVLSSVTLRRKVGSGS